MKLYIYSLVFASSLSIAQTNNAVQDVQSFVLPATESNKSQMVLEQLFDSDSAMRCVPADKNYTHYGVLDDKTLILANAQNDTLLTALRFSCPRLLEENRVFILFRKGDGLSRVGSRMCADDAFMMIWEDVVSVKSSDSLRSCVFRKFYPIPIDDAFGLLRSKEIEFKSIGIL